MKKTLAIVLVWAVVAVELTAGSTKLAVIGAIAMIAVGCWATKIIVSNESVLFHRRRQDLTKWNGDDVQGG